MEIPLFPLHTVLCPGIVVPLHIFEERYRAMTRHCLETGTPFGIVLIRDGREVGAGGRLALAGVGALVEIRKAGRYPDGRYDLLAAATGRFAIRTLDLSRAPYIVAEVTPLEDDVGDELRAERLAATAIRKFVRYLELMRTREGESGDALDIQIELDRPDTQDTDTEDADTEDADTEDTEDALSPDMTGSATIPDAREAPAATEPSETSAAVDRLAVASLGIPDDPTVLSYLLSGIIEVELPRRQRLLEASTTVQRLEELVTLLDREILLLGLRLRLSVPDQAMSEGSRRS